MTVLLRAHLRLFILIDLMDAQQLTQRLKTEAQQIGFDLVGCCPAVEPPDLALFRKWLDSGYAGEMDYIARRKHAYEHPRHVLNDTQSILMLAVCYRSTSAETTKPGQGRISSYAWSSADYHDVIHERLKQLIQFLHQLAPEAQARGVVDTAPLMERDFARLAGLGWLGKNTLLLNPNLGSQFFLAAVLTDLKLIYDQPFTTDHCGTCRACLDACPTKAFPQPYVLDAQRCISYLTIELRDHFPLELRDQVDDWMFGCDVCQDVCPWNHRAPNSSDATWDPVADRNPTELAPLFDLDDEAFRKLFRRTPLWRSRRSGILRNAAIVLGNHPCPDGEQALQQGLCDESPLVRSACAWALRHYNSGHARHQLQERLLVETDPEVLQELKNSLMVSGEGDTAGGDQSPFR